MPYKRAVSLFSNCGAGDLGYRRAGFRFDVMAELDPRRLEVSLLNHPGATGVPLDLRETWPQVVAAYRLKAGGEAPALLAACPPCQGISSAQCNRGCGEDADVGSKDERNLLVVVIAQVAQELKPKLIVVENVPAFLTRKVRHPVTQEAVSAANLLISLLETDYVVFPILANLCNFGVPQTRKRSFLTFIRRDTPSLVQLIADNRSPYPRPSHAPEYGGSEPIQLRNALQSFGLPSLDAATAQQARSDVPGGLHFVPVWKDHRYPMVQAVTPNSGKSCWENNKCGSCGEVAVGKNDVTCPICDEPLLRPVVREKSGKYRLVTGFRSSSYRRMAPDKPASTVTTASGHMGSDSTIHPYENRLLSTLECAYLQTFPTDFNWGNALKKWGHSNIRSMIGEAVPPHFTYLHGQVLNSVLTGRWTSASISSSDPRCVSAREKLGLSCVSLPDGE